MKRENISIPSVKKDIFKSFMYSVIVILTLAIIMYLYGNINKVGSEMTSIFGAILAFSGLMTKQYFIKENIQYLHKLKEAESIIDSISSKSNCESFEIEGITKRLDEYKILLNSYMKYIVYEIKIIPYIPLLLVVFYGAALIASESKLFRLFCLSIMICLISYIAQATITSINLAIDTTNLDETICDLKDLLMQLQENDSLNNQNG